jgi:hypothetical protein
MARKPYPSIVKKKNDICTLNSREIKVRAIDKHLIPKGERVALMREML